MLSSPGRAALTLLLAVALSSCGDPGSPEPGAPTDTLPPFDAVACVDPGALDPQVQPEVALTGPTNNAVLVDGDVAWVVHSGDNTVGRLDLQTLQMDPGFVDVGQEANPWEVAAGADRLYISTYLTAEVVVADRATGDVLGRVPTPGAALSGLAIAGDLLVVADSGFDQGAYTAGHLYAFRRLDAAPWLEPLVDLSASADNTADVVHDEARGRLLAVSTGARGATGDDGAFGLTSPGAVDVLDLAALEAGQGEGARVVSIPLPLDPDDPFNGGPRTAVLTPDARFAYLPSAASPHLFKLDLESLAWARGVDDPIVAYLGGGNQLTSMAMADDGLAVVAAYNQDAAYVFDTSCDASILGPLEVGNTSLLEGPVDVAWDPARGRAAVILSVSSAVSVVGW